MNHITFTGIGWTIVTIVAFSIAKFLLKGLATSKKDGEELDTPTGCFMFLLYLFTFCSAITAWHCFEKGFFG